MTLRIHRYLPFTKVEGPGERVCTTTAATGQPRLIEGMLTSRQIDPAQAYAWKQGMPNWVPFLQVPELATLVAPPAAAVAPPTLPMGGSAPTQATASVDLNNATVEQLLTLPEFTLPMAEQLVAERGQRGGFQSVEQVAQFLNLKPHQADKLARTAMLHPFQGARPATSSSAPASGRVIDF